MNSCKTLPTILTSSLKVLFTRSQCSESALLVLSCLEVHIWAGSHTVTIARYVQDRDLIEMLKHTNQATMYLSYPPPQISQPQRRLNPPPSPTYVPDASLMEMILFILARDTTTSSKTGMLPPTRPVLPPCGTTARLLRTGKRWG